MPAKIYDPEKIYLLVDNEYYQEDKFVNDGVVIIKLSEYSNMCTNSYPKIHKVSASILELRVYRDRKWHTK